MREGSCSGAAGHGGREGAHQLLGTCTGRERFVEHAERGCKESSACQATSQIKIAWVQLPIRLAWVVIAVHHKRHEGGGGAALHRRTLTRLQQQAAQASPPELLGYRPAQSVQR